MSYPQVKILHWFNQVYSMLPNTKTLENLYGIATAEHRVGIEQRRGRERKRAMDLRSERWSIGRR
jgi:hypothetical protein